jgi:hypothetical protein
MAWRLSKSSNRDRRGAGYGGLAGFGLLKTSQLQPKQICGILFNGRLPQLLGAAFPRNLKKLNKISEIFERQSEANGLKREALGRQWNYPVHPGNAKQAMEPATLWFERRVRRVQTCDKRQTLRAWAKVLKGGDYPSFQYQLIYE